MKTYRVKITLNEAALEQAKNMRNLRGIETPVDFEGPDFQSIANSNIQDGFLNLFTSTGEIYSYPTSSIARIASYGIDV